MRYGSKELTRIQLVMVLAAAMAWVVLIAAPGSIAASRPCELQGIGAGPASASLKMLIMMTSPVTLMSGWLLMLTAMMLPALATPVHHIYKSSFTHRRFRSITFFLFGYGAVWILIGAMLMAIELIVLLAFPHPSEAYLAGVAALFIAIVWQCSPIKQRTLNRCHSHPELAAFGMAADLSALRFGLAHGIWCACSCWLWMLASMLLPKWDLLAMALVSLLVFSERLEQPRIPSWRPRGLGRIIRMLFQQLRLRSQSNRLGLAPYSTQP